MPNLAFGAGLTPQFASPPPGLSDPEDILTEETGLRFGRDGPRVSPLVTEGELVARGAPLACLRNAPEVRYVAPVSGRIGRLELRPGHRVAEIVLFREGGDVETAPAEDLETEAGLRRVMQQAGFWPLLTRRPFGGIPAPAERPAAIFVMAADTRPLAPDPRAALEGREEAFSRALTALARLTDGPVFVVHQPGPDLIGPQSGGGQVQTLNCGTRHPQAAPGIQIHRRFPAGLEAPVWSVQAEDVAALGALMETGLLPMTRLVRIGGAALREGRLVRTQIGADLRQLTQRLALPGAHTVLSGSPLGGREARWLAPKDRQVSVLPHPAQAAAPHWLVTALTRSARPEPIIPTAALSQALGGELPAAVFVRALTSGDDETAIKLGVLSLLEEDLALADYVLGGKAGLAGLLRGMLDRIRTELAA